MNEWPSHTCIIFYFIYLFEHTLLYQWHTPNGGAFNYKIT
jgi:hypothetical protein